MTTLLQTLLLQTLPLDLDPVLLSYIEIVLPAVEREFGKLAGFYRSQNDWVTPPSNQNATPGVIPRINNSDSSLVGYVLNSLLITWNLLPLLNAKLALSNDEKRLGICN